MNRMIKFILGTLFGGVIGVMWMCLASIVDDVDDLVEMMEEETEESEEQEEPEIEEDNYGVETEEMRWDI